MNKWSEALRGMDSAAPSAGDPGMGVGNIPFAPGMMAKQMQGPQMQAGPRPGMGGQPGMDVQPMMQMQAQGQGNPQLAQMQMSQHVLQYLMSLLNPANPKMKTTTTGGYMPGRR